MQKRTGGCLCGAVRFEVKGDPEMLHACHCRNCQLMIGSAFAICLYFPEQDITITSGDLTTFVRSCDSGRTIDIHFCQTCGSTLVWEPTVLEGKEDWLVVILMRQIGLRIIIIIGVKVSTTG